MSSRTRILVVAVVVALLAAGGGAWWLLRDEAPAQVSLQTAVEGVGPPPTTSGSPSSSPTPGSGTGTGTADGIAGTWTVDTESGAFDFESATGTFVGFRIQENLASIGSTTAVGRTGDVSGSITIDGTTLTAARFEVDLTSITTNESRRDDQVQRALATGQFPTATFTLTDPVDLGASAATGGPVSVTAAGELTLHGVTKAIQIPIEAQLVNGTVVVVGSTDLTFADFGVEVPKAPIVVSVDDHGPLELQILLRRS